MGATSLHFVLYADAHIEYPILPDTFNAVARWQSGDGEGVHASIPLIMKQINAPNKPMLK